MKNKTFMPQGKQKDFIPEENLDYGLECSSRLILWLTEAENYQKRINTEM